MSFLSGNRERLAGVQGTAMSPLVEVGCFERPAWMPTLLRLDADALRDALDYSGFGHRAASRPSHLDTPRRPFVQAVLRKGLATSRDRQSCELTRRVPLAMAPRRVGTLLASLIAARLSARDPHARPSRRGAWPSSGPGASWPRPRWLASCASCRR